MSALPFFCFMGHKTKGGKGANGVEIRVKA